MEKETDQNKNNGIHKNHLWKRIDYWETSGPIRQLVIWGWDKEHNPAFLMLYGEQLLVKDGQRARYLDGGYLLEEEVCYTRYTIVSGKNGHLPSFFYDDYHIGAPESAVDSKCIFNIKSKEKIVFSFYKEIEYKDYVEQILKAKPSFLDKEFQIAQNPNEILQLEESVNPYFHTICEMMSHPNRYLRKKRLSELMKQEVADSIYKRLMEIGSAELIAGMFLEFAKIKNPILFEMASQINQMEPFVEEGYWNGIKRCANIYKNCVDDKKREDRIKQIQKEHKEMDIELIYVHSSGEMSSKELKGTAYRELALQGYLGTHIMDLVDSKTWKWEYVPTMTRYKKSIYIDGKKLNIIEVKNTIQEAEVLGLADVIGDIAYYMDAPRLYYYFRGTGLSKVQRYFKRYLKRVINQYAKEDSDRFMMAMESLFTSYQEEDYLCKFAGNFQHNEFIKYYLYYEFDEQPVEPISWNAWEEWKEYHKFFSEDHLLKAEGRYEYRKDIWDNHLEVVIRIALKASIKTVIKACYFILKEAQEKNRLDAILSIEQIIMLMDSVYEPLSDLASDIMKTRLNTIEEISLEYIFFFMKSTKHTLNKIAFDYLSRPIPIDLKFLVDMLQIEHRELYFEPWKNRMLALLPEEVVFFLFELLKQKELLEKCVLTEEEMYVLRQITDKVRELDWQKKFELYQMLCDLLLSNEEIPQFIFELIQDTLCSYSKHDMVQMMNTYSFELHKKQLMEQNYMVLSLLEAVSQEKLPSAAEIIRMEEKGNGKLFSLLFQHLEDNVSLLAEKEDIILVLAESSIVVFNQIVEKTFDSADAEQRRRLLSTLLDSPVKQAFDLGMEQIQQEYEKFVPIEWLQKLMEHPAKEVKAFVAKKIEQIVKELENESVEQFLYYIKALLYLPNKISKEKQRIYKAIPEFVKKYPSQKEVVEQILLELGGSNFKIDSERALVALAEIRSEVLNIEG